MARIDKIELNINGEDHVFNINVGKAGIFKCNMPHKIANLLGIEGRLEFSKLEDLKSAIYTKYHAFLESDVEVTVWIGIVYKSSGHFQKNGNNEYMFHGWNHEFKDNVTRFGTGDSIIFGYDFYIKEKFSTGKEVWCKAKKKDLNYELSFGQKRHEGFVYSQNSTSVYGRVIPYSEQAEETLKKGKEGLRMISETLFNFINRDTKLIEASLINGNLLTEGK